MDISDPKRRRINSNDNNTSAELCVAQKSVSPLICIDLHVISRTFGSSDTDSTCFSKEPQFTDNTKMGNACSKKGGGVGTGLKAEDRADEFIISNTTATRSQQKLGRNIVHAEFERDINEFYKLEDGVELGHGISGSVTTVLHRDTEITFACKTLDKVRRCIVCGWLCGVPTHTPPPQIPHCHGQSS